MASSLSAEQHKLKGNSLFKEKAYDDAILEYSTAISPSHNAPYPNMAVLVNQLAYELALEQRSAFTKDIVAMIAEAKKQKWIEDERRNLSQVSETYRYLANLVEQDNRRQVDALDKTASDYEDDVAYLRSDRDDRLRQLEAMMQRAGTPDEYAKPYIRHKAQTPTNSVVSPAASPQPASKQSEAPVLVREVPDYFLDKITFEFMHDPVISTKSGISYERSTLLEHFSYGRMFDPVAQVPLTERDIVPNRALKEACDDFLSKNGWAVDY
ncbi:STIP1 y and U box-containing protein 1 [Dissophora ornata]|nr:STIP1 y and U box-containing protein 1 [Dissophora ornata]